jgi:hypothetical protein
MIVLLHVIIALTSVAYTTYLYFRPSKRKFYASYGLITATLASGTYLVVSTHAPLVSSCISGLAYLLLLSFGLVIASHRLTPDNGNSTLKTRKNYPYGLNSGFSESEGVVAVRKSSSSLLEGLYTFLNGRYRL